MTGEEVRNTSFSPLNTSFARAANSGPRWSMVGLLRARSTRSGTLVGPGIWRKCRPVWTVLLDMTCGAPDILHAKICAMRDFVGADCIQIILFHNPKIRYV